MTHVVCGVIRCRWYRELPASARQERRLVGIRTWRVRLLEWRRGSIRVRTQRGQGQRQPIRQLLSRVVHVDQWRDQHDAELHGYCSNRCGLLQLELAAMFDGFERPRIVDRRHRDGDPGLDGDHLNGLHLRLPSHSIGRNDNNTLEAEDAI